MLRFNRPVSRCRPNRERRAIVWYRQADFFAPPGRSVLTFEFSGNFARDMTYTIGWAVFALALLFAGIWQRARLARTAPAIPRSRPRPVRA